MSKRKHKSANASAGHAAESKDDTPSASGTKPDHPDLPPLTKRPVLLALTTIGMVGWMIFLLVMALLG